VLPHKETSDISVLKLCQLPRLANSPVPNSLFALEKGGIAEFAPAHIQSGRRLDELALEFVVCVPAMAYRIGWRMLPDWGLRFRSVGAWVIFAA
jgi:hypothetical protein